MTLGKLFYRARMRRSIDEAKKFYFKKRQLEDPEADLSALKGGHSSIPKG